MRPRSIVPRRWLLAGGLVAAALVACQPDRPTGASDTSARPAVVAQDPVAPNVSFTPCPTCIFGVLEVERGTGKPESYNFTFPAVPASRYALEVIGSRGADVTVTLNGVTLVSGERSDSVRIAVALIGSNVLTVRQAGRPQSVVSVAVRAQPPIGLSDVVITSPTVVSPIGVTAFSFDSRVTNYTATPYGNMAVRSTLLQGTLRRSTGFRPVVCPTGGPGFLPPGLCLLLGSVATLLPAPPNVTPIFPGPASLIVEVVQWTPTDTTIFEADTIPIVLQPLQVTNLTLSPSHLEFPQPGMMGMVEGTITTSPFYPLSLIPGYFSIFPLQPAIAVASTPEFVFPNTFRSRVIAVSYGGALIRAVTPLDPSPQATTLVSVGVTPSFGAGINVSPGVVSVPRRGSFRPVAQVLAPPYGPLFWQSSLPPVASVDPTGLIMTNTPGSATITVRAGAPFDPRVGTVNVSVYPFGMVVPPAPIMIAAFPGSPSGLPTSLTVSARAPDPLGTLDPGPVRVTFFSNRSLFGDPVGPSVTTPGVVSLPPGQGREFIWTQSWAPGPSLCCGTYKVFARTSGPFGITSTDDSLTVVIVP